MPTRKKKSGKKRPRSSFWDALFGQIFGDSPKPNEAMPIPPPPNFDPELLEEMLREGYRTLAKRYHPDHGGDSEKMLELNRIKQELGF